MHRLMIDLTDEQWTKLQQLAIERTKQAAKTCDKRRFTPADCVKDFIDYCRPGGSGWRNPSETEVHG